jgi:phosphoribosyl 1,2-cyclic phosphodiesterase
MRVVSLGSGSSGNAFLVEAGPQGRTKVLIDAGLNARMITGRLASVGVLPAQLQGILVTHEHIDHVQGIPQLVKLYALPIIANARTLQAIEDGISSGVWRSDLGRLVSNKTRESSTQPQPRRSFSAETALASSPQDLAQTMSISVSQIIATTVTAAPITVLPRIELTVGVKHVIGDIEVLPFAVSHDAVEPCGYLLHAGGCRLCLITDTGEVTLSMLEYIQQADLLILESNHDRERLLGGPYPWVLKRRILSPIGHLSNDQTADAVLRTWREDGMRWLWLAHLSRTNNTPALALESMWAHLRAAKANLTRICITALPPTMGQVWDSTRLWQ